MIKSITVVNDLNEYLTLKLKSPEQSSGFFIKGVDGFGPVKANINTSESLSLDGATFNSARLGYRNVVITLGFLEATTIEETRHRSYRFFPQKRNIQLYVETDTGIIWTNGYVESNEPSIFSDDEDTIISIICPDPYFYSTEKQSVEFTNSFSNFSFPFSNESLTEKLIEFGTILAGAQSIANYSGDAPIGIIMYIHAVGDVGNLSIYNLRTREVMTIDSDILLALTGQGISAGDDIVISTIKGKKSVTLYRGGETINILNALGPDSVWFTLENGSNPFYYTADSGGTNISFRIEYDTIYEGV